jgi:hypothetical protein
MALETATTLSGLVTANPTSIDPIAQGDDHLRLIKDVLKQQFPGAAGQGYAIPILATEAELNLLVGLTSLPFPVNTKMPFYQAVPPVGWSATTVTNDSMMRVVTSGTTGGVANAGGGQSPILNNTVPSHTHVFTGSAMSPHSHTSPPHNHPPQAGTQGFDVYTPGTGTHFMNTGTNRTQQLVTGDTAVTVSSITAGTPTGTNAANAGAADWAPRFCDFCIGTKT